MAKPNWFDPLIEKSDWDKIKEHESSLIFPDPSVEPILTQVDLCNGCNKKAVGLVDGLCFSCLSTKNNWV